MRLFLSAVIIGAMGLLVGGCAAHNAGALSGSIVKIEKVSDPKPGYIVSATAVSESGTPVTLPRVLVKAGDRGSVELQKQSTVPEFVMNTDSFGSVVCQSGRGYRYLVKIEETPNPDMVKAGFFVLFVQNGEDGLVSVQHLDVPPMLLPLNKELLLFKQTGETTFCTVNGTGKDKVKFEFVNK
ncbi:hypothetical protein [uncultured Victivallis sp.]|uniref:hypothetical protein n=1 Tax=uncultured Victivallis sp. TaxID=354118 RepID=UPI0025DF9A9F|nr:hypothetical protein [uncultured Victivallis sp.]